MAAILISGLALSNNPLLKVRNPENPESIIYKANEPTITPKEAIMVMILIALLLVLVNKYLLAM